MIPKIFHQIWLSESDQEPPSEAAELGQTWIEMNPGFKYRLWRNEDVDLLLSQSTKEIRSLYASYEYNIQRVDCLKYLILHQVGGIYVDMDYECIKPISRLLSGGDCYMSCESDTAPMVIGNGFIASQLGSSFMYFLIGNLNAAYVLNLDNKKDKLNFVLQTTGPGFMTEMYHKFGKKEILRIYPTKVLSPLRPHESRAIFRNGSVDEHLRRKIEKAYAIHYSFTLWLQATE